MGKAVCAAPGFDDRLCRRTICKIEAQDYLQRRINGVEEPIVIRVAQSRNALIDVLEDAIGSLHWRDFETLVDIMFAKNGWHRVSPHGGSQKTIDLELEQVTTNERARGSGQIGGIQSLRRRYPDDRSIEHPGASARR